MKIYLVIFLLFPATMLWAQDPSCNIYVEVFDLELSKEHHYQLHIIPNQSLYPGLKVKTQLVSSEKGKGILMGHYSRFCYPNKKYNPNFYLIVSRVLNTDSLGQNTREIEYMKTPIPLIPGTTRVSIQQFEPGIGYAEMFYPDKRFDQEYFNEHDRIALKKMNSIRVVVKPMAPGLIFNRSHLDPSFKKFEDQLVRAVYSEDTTLLKTLLAEEIADGLMDFNSKKEFMVVHNHLWDRLKKIIGYGFHRGYGSVPESFNDTSRFTAPSYLKGLKTSNGSGMNRIFILEHDLKVRAQADTLSKVVGQLTYEMVEPIIDENMEEVEVQNQQQVWIKIKLPGGGSGYVPKKYTSEHQYDTLIVSKIDGTWKITTFHGDTRDW